MTGNRLSTIRDFIGQHVHVDFTDDQDIFDTTGVSSMFAVQLVMWVQRTFAIEVGSADLDLDHFRTVRHIEKFVETKLATATSTVG
jgi:methoxymalonate biosynthesis acyl carrier protein